MPLMQAYLKLGRLVDDSASTADSRGRMRDGYGIQANVQRMPVDNQRVALVE